MTVAHTLRPRSATPLPTIHITTDLHAVNIPADMLQPPLLSTTRQTHDAHNVYTSTNIYIATAKHSDTTAWAFVATAQAQDDRHTFLGAAANFLDHDTLQGHTIPMPTSRAAYAIATTYALAATISHSWPRRIRIHTSTPTAAAARAGMLLTGVGTLSTTLLTVSHMAAHTSTVTYDAMDHKKYPQCLARACAHAASWLRPFFDYWFVVRLDNWAIVLNAPPRLPARFLSQLTSCTTTPNARRQSTRIRHTSTNAPTPRPKLQRFRSQVATPH